MVALLVKAQSRAMRDTADTKGRLDLLSIMSKGKDMPNVLANGVINLLNPQISSLIKRWQVPKTQNSQGVIQMIYTRPHDFQFTPQYSSL